MVYQHQAHSALKHGAAIELGVGSMEELFYEEVEPNHFVLLPQYFVVDKDAMCDLEKYYYIIDEKKIRATHVVLRLYDKTITIDSLGENLYNNRVIWDKVFFDKKGVFKIKLRFLDKTEIETKHSKVHTQSPYADGILAILNTFGYDADTKRWYGGKIDKDGDMLVAWYSNAYAVIVKVPEKYLLKVLSENKEILHGCGIEKINVSTGCEKKWLPIMKQYGCVDVYCDKYFLYIPVVIRTTGNRYSPPYHINNYVYAVKYSLKDCINALLSTANVILMGRDLTSFLTKEILYVIHEYMKDTRVRKYKYILKDISICQNTDNAVVLLLVLLIQMKQEYNFNLYEYYEQRKRDD